MFQRYLKMCTVFSLVLLVLAAMPFLLQGKNGKEKPVYSLAFISDRYDVDGRTHLWVVDSDGDNLRQVTAFEAPWQVLEPTFSNDGSRVLFTKEDAPNLHRSELWTADIADGRLTVINDPGPLPGGHCGVLNWALDDGEILFTSEQGNHNGWFQLWKAAGDGSSIMLCNSAGNAPRGDYSPDGTGIVYAYSSNYNRPSQIMLKPVDCSGGGTVLLPSNLWPYSYGPVGNLAWISPEQILFCIGPYNGDYNIYLCNPVNQTYQPLMDTDGYHMFGRFRKEGKKAVSPDGTKLLFYSNRTGNYEIHMMNLDGTELQQLTANGAENRNPFFSPDGERIFYISNVSGTYSLWMMDNDGGNPVQITDDTGNETDFTVGNALGASITIISPVGGDQLSLGSVFTIRWRATGEMKDTVKIELRQRNKKVLKITNRTPNDGEFEWKIPRRLEPGEYYIRIRSQNKKVVANSDLFVITTSTP